MKTWKNIVNEVNEMNKCSRSTKIYLNIVFGLLFIFFYLAGYMTGKCTPDYKLDDNDEEDDF
jgi:hypothetical protein